MLVLGLIFSKYQVNKQLRHANGTFLLSALTTTDGSWYSVTLRSAAGGRGSLHLGSTTAPSGAVHEKSYVQAPCALSSIRLSHLPLILSLLRVCVCAGSGRR